MTLWLQIVGLAVYTVLVAWCFYRVGYNICEGKVMGIFEDDGEDEEGS